MTEKVGILIETTDKTTSVLKGIGKTGKSALEGVRTAGEKAGSALKAVGMAATFMNQAMELAKKGIEIFKMLIVENVRAMVEYRGEADSVAQKFREIADEAAFTRAVIADLLTPVIFGLADAYKKTGSTIVDYINTNRHLIATNIVNFLMDTAEVLIKGVAMGAETVNKSVSGLILIWDTLKIAVNTTIGGILSGLNKLLLGLYDVAKAAGDEGLAAAMARAGRSAEELANQFKESANSAKTDLTEHVAGMEKREAMIKRFRGIALTFTGEARAAMLAYAASWVSVGRKVGETTTEVTKHNDEVKEGLSQMQGMWIGYAGAVGTAMGDLVTQQASANETIRSLAITTVQTVLSASMVEAAAKAIAAHSGIPFVGVAIGLTFAAAAVSAILGYAAKAKGFQHGGVVTGGTPGRDSVPAMLTPGERVLTIAERRAYERGGGINITFAPKIDMLSLPNATQRKQLLLDLADDFDELVSGGQFARGLQRA